MPNRVAAMPCLKAGQSRSSLHVSVHAESTAEQICGRQARGNVHSARSTSAPLDPCASAPQTTAWMRRRGTAHAVRVVKPTRAITTPPKRLVSVHNMLDGTTRRTTVWRSNREQPCKNARRKGPASKSSARKRSGDWRQKRSVLAARLPWQATTRRASACAWGHTRCLPSGMRHPLQTEPPGSSRVSAWAQGGVCQAGDSGAYADALSPTQGDNRAKSMPIRGTGASRCCSGPTPAPRICHRLPSGLSLCVAGDNGVPHRHAQRKERG